MAKLCGGRLVVEMGRVATVRLANPRKANPLSLDLMRALHGALDDIDADPSVRALQLTHDGAWFSSGHDIHDLFHISAGACKVRVRAAARCFQPYGGRLHTHTHTHTPRRAETLGRLFDFRCAWLAAVAGAGGRTAARRVLGVLGADDAPALDAPTYGGLGAR